MPTVGNGDFLVPTGRRSGTPPRNGGQRTPENGRRPYTPDGRTSSVQNVKVSVDNVNS